ncbi:hypothetical protein DF038_10770 [Burkholderia cepacia]|nr:hypothetical protein DF038_10770 [Burkholderia cepacia]
MPSSVVERDGIRYLYYIGCNVRNSVPYHNSMALAISEDGSRCYRLDAVVVVPPRRFLMRSVELSRVHQRVPHCRRPAGLTVTILSEARRDDA